MDSRTIMFKMKKWEYMIVDSKDVDGGSIFRKSKDRSEVDKYLNRLGQEGWEINLDFRELKNRFECIGVAKREKGA